MLIYYFGFELFIRFLMQSTPAMSITPYLHLPVRRSFLMHLLLSRSIINPLNYISFLIFLPFALRAVTMYYSGAAACWWLLAIFLMLFVIIYANVYIKRQMTIKPVVSLSCGLVFITLIVLEYFKLFSLSSVSSFLFDGVLTQPMWLLTLLALAAGVYWLNYRFLKANAYLEEINSKAGKKQVTVQNLSFMSRFGQIGELISMELKLILRHKRTKSVLLITPFFWLYGLIFYPNPMYNNMIGWLIFTGIISTGWMMACYGQFIVAWEGKFFDGILTREGGLYDYFRAKFYLLASFCLLSYLITTPYVYFGARIFWIQTACFLFNIGFGTYNMLWFAQFNCKKIELSQGSAFNWQGTSASQFVVMIPILVLPMVIAGIFSLVGLGDWGLSVLGLIGIAGILCHKWILRYISAQLAEKKYKMAEGYRGN